MLQDLGRESAGYGAAPDMEEYSQKAQDRAFGSLPVRSFRRSFEEFDSAEDRETQGGEIRHDLDTSLIDPEDYDFEPNQNVTLNKKLEIMIGGGVPVTLNKGTKGVIESRYDGEGDYYYVRFEDGQIARVLYSDLSGGKSASIEDYAAFLMSLT